MWSTQQLNQWNKKISPKKWPFNTCILLHWHTSPIIHIKLCLHINICYSIWIEILLTASCKCSTAAETVEHTSTGLYHQNISACCGQQQYVSTFMAHIVAGTYHRRRQYMPTFTAHIVGSRQRKKQTLKDDDDWWWYHDDHHYIYRNMLDLIFVKVESSMQLLSEI